jgi:hypothetical protein
VSDAVPGNGLDVTFARVCQRPKKTIAWHTGAKNGIPWTLTMNPDGEAALATRTVAGTTTTAIFKRVAAASARNVTRPRPGKKGKRP